MAANQILSKLTGQAAGNNSPLSNAIALARSLRGAQNPQQFLQELVSKNPNVRQAMEFMQNYDSPEAAYYALARQKGVDPEAFLQNFR